MNILQRLKAVYNASKVLRSTAFVLQGQQAKRQPFDYRTATRGYSSWIFAAANLNAVAVASQPLRLYVRNRSAGTKLWRTSRVSRIRKSYMAGDAQQIPSHSVIRKAAEFGDDYEVVTESHPVLELLSKMNPWMNGFEGAVLRTLYAELTGNAYLHPIIDKALGIPVQLWVLPSQNVQIVPGKERFIDGYLYGATHEQSQLFLPDEVIHFKRPNPGDAYYGMGKLEAAWGAAQANVALHEMDLSWFENKARPDMLVSIRGDADPEELSRFEAQIEEKLRGRGRTGRFLTATAEIDVKPLNFPGKDMQGRKEIVEEIAAVFGVPVSMLMANDPNLASASVGFASWKATSVLPLLRMDEEVLNQNLLPMFGIDDDAFLSYDNPVREDERLELERVRSLVVQGVMTINEARTRQGLDLSDQPEADMLLYNGQPLGAPQQPVAAGMPQQMQAAPQSLPPANGQDRTSQAAAAPSAERDEAKEMPEVKAADDCVSDKIRTLLGEGYERDQAIAIAISMCERSKAKSLEDIDTVPPQSVADNARRALEVRKEKPESQRGMTAVGIARARDLSNRTALSEDTIRRMARYFTRHQSDKKGQTWDEQGPGWQAWMGWGGDEGWSWARRKVEEFDRARESSGTKAMTLARGGMALKDCGTGAGGFKPGNTCGQEDGSGSGRSPSRSAAMSFPGARAGQEGVVELPVADERGTMTLKQTRDAHARVVSEWTKADDLSEAEHQKLVTGVRRAATSEYTESARLWSASPDDEMALVAEQRLQLKGSTGDPARAAQLKQIERAAQAKLPKAMSVTRGFALRGDEAVAFVDSLKEGAEVRTGIISTTTASSVADQFGPLPANRNGGRRVLFRIRTDRGIVAMANPDIAASPDESRLQEVVLAPKALRIVGRTTVRTSGRQNAVGRLGPKADWDTIMIDAEAVYD